MIEKSIEANSNILDLGKDYGLSVNKPSLVASMLSSSNSAEHECIDHLLSGFATQKQDTKKINDVFKIIKKEDEFLSKLKINKAESADLDKPLKDRLELAKSGKSKDIIDNIKKNIEANCKQGIISHADLRNKILASGYDIKRLDVVLEQLAVNGRSKYLESISIELSEIRKLGSYYDKDKLVGTLKSMPEQEREKYGNKLLGEAAKQHIEPILHKYDKERNNASNFLQFLSIVTKEQEVHRKLYTDHPFAIRALDRINGDLKYSTITSYACQIDRKFSTEKVISILSVAVKNNIISSDKVMQEINKRSGSLHTINHEVKALCNVYKSEQAKTMKESQKSCEKEKHPEIKIDKGFSM